MASGAVATAMGRVASGMGRVPSVAQSIPASADASSSSDDESDTWEPAGVPDEDAAEGAEEDYFDRDRSIPAMVWDDDRPEDHGITSAEATMSLITAIIGAGIMALPQLPKTGGMVFPILLMFVGTLATMEAGSAFFRAQMANNIAVQHKLKAAQVFIHTYEDFGTAAYGRPGAILVRVITITWFLGLCSAYVVLLGQNLQSIVGHVYPISYRIWVFILSPLLWFLSMLRDVSAIAKLMPIGVASAVASCVIIIVKSTMDSSDWEDWPEEDLQQLHHTWPTGNLMALGSLSATVIGALSCMGNVPSIIDEMKRKHRFKRSFRTALSTVMVLYAGIMLMGYYGYGNFIQPNIVNSMIYHPATFEEASTLPPKEWTGRRTDIIAVIMSSCVVINLIISYPLNMAPVFIAIQGTSFGKDSFKVGTKKNYLMRTSCVVLTIVIPLVLTEFSLVYSLFASLCGPIQGVLAPIYFGRKIRQRVGARNSGVVRNLWHAFLAVISVLCIVVGFTDSVMNIIKFFQK